MEKFLAYRVINGYLKLDDIPNEELREKVRNIIKELEANNG